MASAPLRAFHRSAGRRNSVVLSADWLGAFTREALALGSGRSSRVVANGRNRRVGIGYLVAGWFVGWSVVVDLLGLAHVFGHLRGARDEHAGGLSV